MKIRNLSKLALAVAISSSVVLEGCKKYDDDITRLEQLIGDNTADIASLKNQLASLAANMVVQSVTSVEGGFDIVFKKPDGSTTNYQIRNGAKGDKGDQGAAGTNGSSPVISIGENGNFWIANNGQAATDTGIKAGGKDGKDGADGKDGEKGEKGDKGENGSIVTIVDGADGKKFWAIDGVATTVQAYTGDVAIEEVAGGYRVVFTNAAGVASDSIFLAKEQVLVSGLELVPTYTNNNTPVVFFPRVVNKHRNGSQNDPERQTILQGYATIKYNLNPYGVNPDFYNAKGLLTQYTDQVSFRSGSGATVNEAFEVVGQTKEYGALTVKIKPTGNSDAVNALFPKHGSSTQDLHVALQVENNKGEGIQKYAASGYTLAKEELVNVKELTIEKHKVVDGKIQLPANYETSNYSLSGDSLTAPSPSSSNLAMRQWSSNPKGFAEAKTKEDFRIHFKNGTTDAGAIKLDEELKGFFYRAQMNGTFASMDDNGLSDYSLWYEFAHSATDEESKFATVDPETGVVKVKKAANNADNYEAIDKYVYVKVTMRAGATNTGAVLAVRYVKILIVQDILDTVKLTASDDVYLKQVESVKNITFTAPNDLGAAYNAIGISQSQFHAFYSIATQKAYKGSVHANNELGSNKITVALSGTGPNATVTVNPSVQPGNYIVKATLKSTVASHPDVELTYNVAVKVEGDITYAPRDVYWSNGAAKVIGESSGNSSWYMGGNVSDYITFNSTIPAAGPSVTMKYSIVTPQDSTPVASINTDGTNLQILDPAAPISKAWRFINKDYVTVKITYHLNGSSAVYKSQTFNVAFTNPVLPVVARNNATQTITDSHNNVDIDLRRFISITDTRNQNVFNTGLFTNTNNATQTLRARYGLTGLSYSPFSGFNGTNLNTTAVEQVGVYLGTVNESNLASATTTTLPSNVSWSVVNSNQSAHARFVNNGTSTISQTVTLVYKIKLYNRYNNGSVASTRDQVEQLVFIVVNPYN